ncbi:HAD family hydrolase [Mesorhizobium sp.]|uniref:HAD family hydrolase n=1 Tax=Mesorhizobium sp. TaxID=1871066 RepID=UPI000FE63309|nr:HAD family hydrolase [Mesorhizobium sp.]RWP96703.1 MAG: hypothetical protein EOR89_23450 [Mesorhizobium sp.]
MHLMLERLTAKIKKDNIYRPSSAQFRMGCDSYGDILPLLPGEDVYRFTGHCDAMFPDGGGLTEKLNKRQKPENLMLWGNMPSADPTAQITAKDITIILDKFEDSVKVLSLDCFDTLLWRKTATPRDVFAVLANNPIAQGLGITSHQRISAAARARRAKPLENGSLEIDLGDIYRSFTSLSEEERVLLAETEIQTEMDVCFAFSPFVELIRLAHTRGIKIIVVSDMYLHEKELRRVLARHLPADVMLAISKLYCSVDHGTSKSRDLFQLVLNDCGVPAEQLLHIGDNDVADVQTPRKLGIRALHFLQFGDDIADFLRLQHTASSLSVLENTRPAAVAPPCYSPFRPIFSVANLQPHSPQTLIGYMSFGPVLYAYARFLVDEVEALQQQGKRVKVFFLLRDAYLLSAACEAYARKPVGKLVRIRKFVAIAASFKTRADVDYYISGIEPEYDSLHATAKQLLLPPELTELLIRIAQQSDDPKTAFHQLLHDDDVLALIFRNSSSLRARLMRYMSKELELEEVDTIVFADIGYNGKTQEYLGRTFNDELNVEILGCYLVASDEPYRAANSKALITSPWWNYTLFEQCCALKEGAVLDYDCDGVPVLGAVKQSEKQYEKVASVQAECLRFINDARTFFINAGVAHEYAILQRTAHAALFRHAYMPVEAELEYFKDFQHEKFVGPDGTKTIYHLEGARKLVRCLPSPYRLGAYETRSLGLDFTFSGLVQRSFQIELDPEDMNVHFSPLKVSAGNKHEFKTFLLKARHLHDGYFSIMLPCVSDTSVKLLLGEHYEWLQIGDIQVLNNARSVCGNLSSSLDLEGIIREGEIYRCLSQASVATIRLVDTQQFKTPHYYYMIFRPLVSRAPQRAGASL